jgi:AcrR family transcriptional regulator
MRTPASYADETALRVRAAAVRTFARKGFAATGLRELATEAQLTPAALYHYMGSKEDLLMGIMRSTIEPLDETARHVLDQLGDSETKLGALVELHVWFHGAWSKETLVTDTELRALQGDHRVEMVAIRDHYQDLWRATLRAGVADGSFDLSDPALTAIGLLELCTGVSHWYSKRGKRNLLDLCALHVDWAFGMVRASRDGRPLRRQDVALPSPAAWFPLPADDSPPHSALERSAPTSGTT